MRQVWELQGRTEEGATWLALKTKRSRRALDLNGVRRRAARIGIKADYRVVLMPACGCGGVIGTGVGCLKYLVSDEFYQDVASESFMRHGGLGFGTHKDPDEATMSMHLQANGMSYEEAERILA